MAGEYNAEIKGKKNFRRTRHKCKYALYKELGMSYQNFSKMINNETASIKYENIEAMCVFFNITPNELFEFDFEK